jgi:UDP-N-acetyl-D-mannosaminuronic acid dehydrogenase
MFNQKMNSKVAVVGLGNIGFPVAKHIQTKFENTIGFDISQQAVDHAQLNHIEASTTFPDADIYVLAVNTWYKNGQINMKAIEETCSKISALKGEDVLVLMESTLAVGTARTMSKKYNLPFIAVCPHRWWSQDENAHGVVQTRVLGAVNDVAHKEALAFYKALEIPIHEVPAAEYAEITKLVENTNYFQEIAYAQNLKMLADSANLDYETLRKAANTKWNVKILEARDGIGGECLPKDIQFLLAVMPDSELLNGLIKSDQQYRQHIAKTVKEPPKQHNKPA